MPLRNIILALLLPVLLGNACVADAGPPQQPAVNDYQTHTLGFDGIRFSCRPEQLEKIESGMARYLASFGIAPELVVKKVDRKNGILFYTLSTPEEDANTLNLQDRPEMQIKEEVVSLPMEHGKKKNIQTVSKKEILLALLQHGRTTEFKGRACNIEALKDHVGIRQNTVAWAEDLMWIWPDGGPANWNEKLWKDGTPKPGYPVYKAVNDVFVNQAKYSIGCYTATKLVVVQGVLDYYRRIKKDKVQLKRVVRRLLADKDPLVAVEPGRMWDFEKDFDPREQNNPGKLVKVEYGAGPRNFVPGDWVYFLNTDPVSYQKIGYEGSNAIYLGRNKFDDYYNDNNHFYTYDEKLNEVYQWRNGVFSRARDFARIQPLTPEDLERLSAPPSEGGLLTTMRVFPYFFGYEELPVREEYLTLE
ncbi:hypothetical protein [Sulfurimicrobium lacus]|nr:hypothetical protein [Sulfurimicrobium lacus]